MRYLPYAIFQSFVHLRITYVYTTIAWESEEIAMNQRHKRSPIHLFVLNNWAGKSIDHLFRNFWKAPKKLIHTLRMEKLVHLNGRVVPMETILSSGDELTIHLENELNDDVIPIQHPLPILYEDEHLLIVNKKAGIATHPNKATDRHTLANAVAFYLQENKDDRKIRHVHRLDKDTTGTLLFAKHALAHAILNRMLTERKIKRTYKALVHGMIQKEKGSLHFPIGRDRHHATRRRVSKTGQHAVTHYRVLRKFTQKNLTLLECTLETGRTHQIRVHMSHLGHPLIGDLLYGGKPIFNRQALHAYSLQFTHPFTNEQVQVFAPFIDDYPTFDDIIK